MITRQGRDADDELRLRCGSLAEQHALTGWQRRCREESRDDAIPGAERGGSEIHGSGVVDVTGHRDDRVRRAIHGPPEVPDRVVGEGPDSRLVPADLSTERAVAEHRCLEQDLRVLGRVVLVAADLLDDDATLTGDLVAAQRRADDQLADHVHPAGRLAMRDAHPVDGRFAVGGRVERATNALDRFADRPRRRVGGRALEGQVLHEMGDAGLGRTLQARTGQDVRGDGDRTRPRHTGADDARPLRQRGPFEHRDGWYRKPSTRPEAPSRVRSERSGAAAPHRSGRRPSTRLSCPRKVRVPSRSVRSRP